MLLARKLQVEVTEEQCYYFSHMSYAAVNSGTFAITKNTTGKNLV